MFKLVLHPLDIFLCVVKLLRQQFYVSRHLTRDDLIKSHRRGAFLQHWSEVILKRTEVVLTEEDASEVSISIEKRVFMRVIIDETHSEHKEVLVQMLEMMRFVELVKLRPSAPC